ncbi:MAG: hypothetical protein LIP09_04310 [Bacteroidales bacterium]|nr:hypothetical protein [Bacteroidales bacterium]
MSDKIIVNPAHPEIKAFAEKIASEGLPSGSEIIYNGRRNQIYKLSAGGRLVTVKAFRVPNPINSVAYATVRKSKARRSYEYALRLNEKGIHSPSPLAYIEKRNGITLARSYYICDFVDAPTVRNWEQRDDADEMLSALAQDMVKMHRLGIWHKDFSPGNILAKGNSKDGYEFYYVDINRMKFDVFDSKKLMQNFRCINLDERETRRLARHFAAAAGLDEKATEDAAAAELHYYRHHKGWQDKIKKLLKIGKYNPKRFKKK